MTKDMEALIHKYWDEDKHDKIVELIMEVPEAERDIDMLGQLVVAYNNLKQYDDAIKLSMELKERSVEKPAWYYRMGFAYVKKHDYETAADYLETGIELANKQRKFEKAENCQNLYNQCLPHLKESRKGKSIQKEALEIVWSEDEDKYIAVKGVVDLGYFGGYRCHQIEVDFDEYDYEKLFSDEDDEGDGISAREYLREGMEHDEIAEGLTAFFNARIQELTDHLTQINQALLAYLLEGMCSCGYPFWEECKSYVFKDKLPSCDSQDLEDAIYTDEVVDGVSDLFDKYDEGSIRDDFDHTPVVENFVEQNLPMFDYRKMFKDVHSEYLTLGTDEISAQCTGEGDADKLVCAAYVCIDNDLSFYEWDNH